MTSRWTGLALACLWTLSATGAARAQLVADRVPESVRGERFQLSIRNIMRAQENVGESPVQLRWTDDSKSLYFRWRPGGLEWNTPRSLYRVSASGGEPEKLTDEEADAIAPLIAGGDLSEDRRWRVSSVRGDLYLVDRRSMEVRRLTHTQDGEGQPIFADDDETIIFRRANNLYRFDIETGVLDQITRIASGPEAREAQEAKGQRAFLEAQQLELFEHIRREEAESARRDSLQDERAAREPETVHLKGGERAQRLTPTHDGRHVLIQAGTRAKGAKPTVIPDWITEDGYTQDINGRSKVGDVQGSSRVGIITTQTGEVAWIDAAPEGYESDAAPRVFNSGWNDTGTTAFVFAVSADNEDRWIWSVDAESGERTLVDQLHDDAWVAGPCFAFCVGFLPGTDRIYFVSEATGYAQLYAVDADGGNRKQLTSGNWEVLGVTIPEDGSRFLLTTNEGSPFNQRLSWLDFDGSDAEPLTAGDGRFVGTLSPNGKRVALVHDVANSPPELYLTDTDDAADPEEMTRVTTSPTEEWSSFPWIKPEIVRFEAEDGTMVPARIYRPSDMGAEAHGGAVIFVHGAGYLHNVHNYWSSYYREYQFNQFLAANGYTVLDVDYRGSAGYGAKWRTAIYRWMGGKDLSDQVDGAKYLAEKEGVDPARIGLYGGSYGGFITLMGLFTAGDTFRSGAALRSVTDWAHYNNGYTDRILNLPQDDEEAYEKSSPIYFAENFRPDQDLLMLHGMVDTNVHFSDIVRLTQRLIELGKENWELAPYPVESHGFIEPTSWTDEYRRIFELFERTLR
jgi:dipeptidyl aminopeptidase/acylaminoacyl peptidase